jgi:hypothetical protein
MILPATLEDVGAASRLMEIVPGFRRAPYSV